MGHDPSGQEMPKVSRVGSGQEMVRTFTARNRSGQESHGSVRVTLTRPDPTRPAAGESTREKP